MKLGKQHRGDPSRLPRLRRVARRAGGPLLLLGALAIAGCFDKPEIEDRWTRVDVQSSSPAPRQTLLPGSMQAINMQTTITYRAIVTGFVVAELRAGDSLASSQMPMDPGAPRVAMAQGIDVILAHSRSLGRATRAVTGWDHLIQPVDFTFNAATPAGPDSTWSGSRLFLLCYLGSGERVERQGLPDSIIITPFVSSEHQVLPVGMDLYVGTP
jgi:hypothetical protein